MNSAMAYSAQPNNFQGLGVVRMMPFGNTDEAALGAMFWAHHLPRLTGIPQSHPGRLLWRMVVFVALGGISMVSMFLTILLHVYLDARAVFAHPLFAKFLETLRVAFAPVLKYCGSTFFVFKVINANSLRVLEPPSFHVLSPLLFVHGLSITFCANKNRNL